jgi:RNA polymerase sigma factor (sigma-70 family)
MNTDHQRSQLLLLDLHRRLKAAFVAGGESALKPHHLHLFWEQALTLAHQWARNLCRGRGGLEAEDIASTAVLELLQTFPRCIVEYDNFVRLLKAVVVRRFLDRCRQRRAAITRAANPEAFDTLEARETDPLHKAAIEQIRHFLAGLDRPDQIVILEIEELLSREEAIRLFGKARPTYYRHKRKLIRRLRHNPQLLRLKRMLE